MEKKTKIFLIVIAVIAIIAIAAIFLWPSIAGKAKKDLPAGNGGSGSPDQKNNLSGPAPIGGSSSNGSSNYVPPKYSALPITQATQLSIGAIASSLFGAPPAVVATLAASNIIAARFPLKNGSGIGVSGGWPEVKTIQMAVNNSIERGIVRGTKLVVDGQWGAKTDAAVRQVYPAGVITADIYSMIASRGTLS